MYSSSWSGVMVSTSSSLTRISFPLPILPADASRRSKWFWTSAHESQSIACTVGSCADIGCLWTSSNGNRSLVAITTRVTNWCSGLSRGFRLPTTGAGYSNVKPKSVCSFLLTGYTSTSKRQRSDSKVCMWYNTPGSASLLISLYSKIGLFNGGNCNLNCR